MSRPVIHKPRILAMIAALLVATLGMFLARKCSHPATSPFSGELPAKSGGDTLDIAIEISPLAYSLSGDTVTGLDYDLLRAMAARHGRAVRFHPFAPMDYALRGLEGGNFDVLVASLASTEKLKEILAITEHVYLDREVLLQRKDAHKFIAAPDQLGGDTVWVADGSPFRERIVNLADEIGDTIIVQSIPGRTAEHLALMVAGGTIPRAVVNEGLASRFTARDTLLDASTPVSFTQFQVWALRKDNTAMRDTLNAWIREFVETPGYKEITGRYLR